MKVTLAVTALFIAIVCFANMASPYITGTKNIAPVTSRNIDIRREMLIIKPGANFETANFSIDYFINADTAGIQVPLLFVAADYADSMAITIDGTPIKLEDIPLSNTFNSGTLSFHDFDNQFDTTAGRKKIKITWQNGLSSYYDLFELKYFKANLTKGPHTIHVQYTAKVEIYRGGWIKNYTCNYYLSPARNWKSFGGLDVMIDKSHFTKPLITNLGKPAADSGATNKWHFDTIPSDVLEITYKPQVPAFAASLIAVGPDRLAFIATIILAIIQVRMMIKYRHHRQRYKTVYYAGAILVPILAYVCFFYAFDLIDFLIGDEASRFHGYIFMYGFTYVVAAPAYAFITYLAGYIIKRSLVKPEVNT